MIILDWLSFLSFATPLLTTAISWANKKREMRSTTTAEQFEQIVAELYKTSSFKNQIAKRLDITFNNATYDLLIERTLVGKGSKGETHQYTIKKQYKKSKVVDERNEKKNSFALTSLIVKHTAKANTASYLYLGASFIVYSGLRMLGLINESNIIPALLLFFALVIFIRHRILVHRIQTGQYGSNEHEAREILKFILDETNKHYFNGKGGAPRIFGEEDLKEVNDAVGKYGMEALKL
ncbi:hypothetical protein [Domibacillus tundrae]|uniref:hypothetical protein n=1 Tax=Domibacillus tundrae TaxID=1587527 RepID=UPI000617D983|nr:hypothetical protein [Domibacillus tundrae]